MMEKEINLFGAFSKFIEGIRNLVPEILGTDNWEREYFSTLINNQKENWSNQRNEVDHPKYLIDFGNLQSFVLNKKEFLGRRYEIRNYNNLPTMFNQITVARNSLMHFIPLNEIKADTAFLQMIQIAEYFNMDELEESLKNLRKNTIKEKTITTIQKGESNRITSLKKKVNGMKIGQFVQHSFRKLFELNLLSESEIIRLQQPEYSSRIFNSNFEVLRNKNRTIKDKHGRTRYYSREVFCGNYHLTSQWIEPQWELLLDWLKKIGYDYKNNAS